MSHPHTPHTPAGVYDYLTEGRDNRPEERNAAQSVLAIAPYAADLARYNRECVLRASRELAERGYRQFLDVGAGLPKPDELHVHEVVQAAGPEAGIVYVDNDPRAHTHEKALLDSGTGTVAFLQADARHPSDILEAPTTRRVIDFEQPVAVLLAAVLHFVQDEEDPARIVRELMAAAAPGSAVVITHVLADGMPEEVRAAIEAMHKGASSPLCLRTRGEIEALFDGLELEEPLVDVQAWHVPSPPPILPMRALVGVAVKR